MFNCSSCKTPVVPGSKLNKTDGDLISDITSFRALVGLLQYLSQTRPDLCYQSGGTVCAWT